MRVAVPLRADHAEMRGGDLVQLRGTADGLRRIGVDVELLDDPRAELSGFDIVHVFNSPRFAESLGFVERARAAGLPVALSTIYWPKAELDVGVRPRGPIGALRRVAGRRNAVRAVDAAQRLVARTRPASAYALERRLMGAADLLLPNSVGEQREIERFFGLRGAPHHVVRNAIDPGLFGGPPRAGRTPQVLSAGRIEPRKNTLSLVRACRAAGLPLVLVGDHRPDDPYARACLREADEAGFEHHRGTSQAELVERYRRAAVYAQPSWYETPGLATMEAVCAGCAVLTTDRGSTREYFGGLAHYCDPWEPGSIAAGLRAALAAGPSEALARHIAQRYTWEGAARDTLAGYERLLDTR